MSPSNLLYFRDREQNMAKIHIRGKREEIGIGVTLEVHIRQGMLTDDDGRIKAILEDDDELVQVRQTDSDTVYVIPYNHEEFLVGEDYDV